MNTAEFVAMQLAKPFPKRRIPDSLYFRNSHFPTVLLDLTEGRQPEHASLCFDNNYMYEGYTRYIGAFHSLYPNVIITEEECLEYNRLCGATNA